MKLFLRTASSKKSGSSGKGKFRLRWKLLILSIPLLAGLGVLFFYAAWAETFDLKTVGDMPERNTVFDVDGKIYSRLAGANRVKVSLSEISPFFITAVLTREDARFYEHK